jgi:hypothetical protein
MFVLQDIADAENYLKIIRGLLKQNGIGIFVFVHPGFGEAMKGKGALKNIRLGDSIDDWSWVAEYPIVEEQGTFYVPYFHRSLDFYKKVFSEFFNQSQYSELMPSERDKALPFSRQANNIYYPEIINSPSSLVAVVFNR